MSRVRIAVVGGGLAGIAAALRAADGGAQVVLLERRSVLGGLTSSIQRNGLFFDNGQHVFLRCCTEYRAFIERIGAADQVFLQGRLDVPVIAPGGSRATLRRMTLPAPLQLAASLLGYHHLSWRERWRVIPAALALRRLDPEDDQLDQVTFADWLARHGQSPRAVDRFWDLITKPTMNVAAADASLAVATKVFRTGFLDTFDGADLGWSKVPLAQLHGENAQRELDAAGVHTRLNTSVKSIDRMTSGSFTLGGDGEKTVADSVIVATPPRVAAALGVVDDVARHLGTSPIVNVHFVLDRRVTNFEVAAGVDSPIEFLFDRTQSSGLTSGQCLVVSLSAAERYISLGTSELVPMFHAALGELLPSSRSAKVVDAVVTRERSATFRARPGVGAFRPPAGTKVPGVYLAGAWCDTGWPATMEGAVRSGNEAARHALSFTTGRSQVAFSDVEEMKS